jgi:hypothetical protein
MKANANPVKNASLLDFVMGKKQVEISRRLTWNAMKRLIT